MFIPLADPQTHDGATAAGEDEPFPGTGATPPGGVPRNQCQSRGQADGKGRGGFITVYYYYYCHAIGASHVDRRIEKAEVGLLLLLYARVCWNSFMVKKAYMYT